MSKKMKKLDIENIMERAKEYKIRDKKVNPAIFFEFKDKTAEILMFKSFNEDNKMEALRQAGKKAHTLAKERNTQLDRAYYIFEAWYSECKDKEWNGLRPKHDPERKEAILVSEINILKNKTKTLMQPFHRINDDIHFGEINTFEQEIQNDTTHAVVKFLNGYFEED